MPGRMTDMDVENKDLDTYIARYALIKTPRDIAEMVGVTPQEVMRRSEEMQDEIDSLSIEAQISFTLRSLNEIAADAKTDASNASDTRDKAALYSSAVAAHAQSLKQLATLKKENDGAVEELNMRRVTELLRLIDVVVAKGVQEIALTYDLEEDELLGVFQSKIVGAAKELEV